MFKSSCVTGNLLKNHLLFTDNTRVISYFMLECCYKLASTVYWRVWYELYIYVQPSYVLVFIMHLFTQK